MEKKLNKEQLQAVKHKTGPLLVIAGAGTGKTTVVTERVKHLITSKLCKSNELLALTFTEKAAREMQERIDIALDYGMTPDWISTFHSFCDRLLRAEGLHIGLDPNYKLMRTAESIQLVHENLFDFDLDYFRPLGNPHKFISAVLSHVSRLQDEDILPSEYVNWVKSQKLKEENKLELKKWKELSDFYKTYDEIKIQNSVLDFGDLIVKTLELFRKRPNVLKTYQEKFKYILVDEYQDTNFAQNNLIKLLAGSDKNVTVVADDDQSIYRFRGAAFSNVIQFREDFKNTHLVVLSKNYRSTKAILDSSYKLIQYNNPDRLETVAKINKKLTSERKLKGETVEFLFEDRVENEAEVLAKKVEELVKKGPTFANASSSQEKYSYKDFAVLVRANSHAEPFARAFERVGIPFQFLGPGKLFKQEEVIDLVSILKVLQDVNDSGNLYRLMMMPHLNISMLDLVKVASFARKKNMSLFEAVEKKDEIAISVESNQKIDKLMGTLQKHLEELRASGVGQVLYSFLDDTKFFKYLLSEKATDGEKKAQNVSKFFDKLKTYEVDHTDRSIAAIIDWIDLSSDLGESPIATDTDWTGNDAVNILTIHSAKGLEFPVVFLVNLVAQRFPTIHRSEALPIPEELIKEVLPKGDFHLQEERRLFYVGMTRARDRLFLTAAAFYGEGKRAKKVSPFVSEALEDVVENNKNRDGNSKNSLFFGRVTKPIAPKSSSSVTVDTISYSQIETFKICPLHYKLRYILGIPTKTTSAISFGDSIHATLFDFYQAVREGRKVNEKFLQDSLSQRWISEGYIDKKHETQMLARGRKYLSEYYKSQFFPKIVPIAIEKDFRMLLPRFDGKSIKIKGVIDRIDPISSRKIEIIDYKTGERVPSQREVDRNLQLSLYALAARELLRQQGMDVEEISLSLYYFQEKRKITTTRNEKQLEGAIKEVYKVKQEIEESDFKCSGHMLCQNCEYKNFCRSDIE